MNETSNILILDANVLLYDPQCIFSYPDAQTFIPVFVIEGIVSTGTSPQLGSYTFSKHIPVTGRSRGDINSILAPLDEREGSIRLLM